MKRVSFIGLIICLISFHFSLFGAYNGLRFQGVLKIQDHPPKGVIQINIRLTDQQEEILFEEEHSVVCSSSGLFDLAIGSGVPIFKNIEQVDWTQQRDLRFHIRARVTPDGDWIDMGNSMIAKVPYAEYAEKSIGDDPSLKDSISNAVMDQHLTFLSAKDTIVHLTEDGNIGILQGEPTLQAQLRRDKVLAFSTDDPNGNYKGAVSFHWTILGSKPAIVGYDYTNRRRFAIVAHYWSVSSFRAHEHISIEVDTEQTGSVETRFALPWGSERSQIQSFAHFSIDKSGGLQLNSKDSSYHAAFYGNTYLSSSLTIGDSASLSNQERSNSIVINNPQEPAQLLIKQGDGNMPARLKLITNNTNTKEISIPSKGILQISDGVSDANSLKIGQDQTLTVGLTTSSSDKLDVNGTVYSDGYVIESSSYQLFLPIKTGCKPGDVIGINPIKRTIHKMEAGLVLIGVATQQTGFQANYDLSLDHTAVAVSTMGEVAVNQDQYTLKDGIAYALDGTQLGIRLANDKIFIKIR